MPPTGDLASNPGMLPDWESNQQPFGPQSKLNPLSHTRQGKQAFLRTSLPSVNHSRSTFGDEQNLLELRYTTL